VPQERYGSETILTAMRKLDSEDSAQVTLSTVHTAKGREWDRVRIASDFNEPPRDEFDHRALPSPEDMMLAYVAVTRAKKVLDPEGLAWVDDYFGGTRGHLRLLGSTRQSNPLGWALYQEGRRAGLLPTPHELAQEHG
jgi:hypothetical protein